MSRSAGLPTHMRGQFDLVGIVETLSGYSRELLLWIDKVLVVGVRSEGCGKVLRPYAKGWSVLRPARLRSNLRQIERRQ